MNELVTMIVPDIVNHW